MTWILGKTFNAAEPSCDLMVTAIQQFRLVPPNPKGDLSIYGQTVLSNFAK